MTGVFETADQREVTERSVADWRLYPIAFVGHERMIVDPTRIALCNTGLAGL